MRGVLLVQTPRHGNDIPLANAAGRERYYSAQVVTEALAVRGAPPEQRATRRLLLERTLDVWLDATGRLRNGAPTNALFAPDEQILPGFAALTSLQREVMVAARAVAIDGSSPTAQEALAASQRRYMRAIDRIVGELEADAAERLDVLVLTETICVLLLLTALGLGVRLALQPTQERLLATVEALAESESRTRAVLDSMQEGMILTDVNGRMLRWNLSALRILGIGDDGSEANLQSVARRSRPRHKIAYDIRRWRSRRI